MAFRSVGRHRPSTFFTERDGVVVSLMERVSAKWLSTMRTKTEIVQIRAGVHVRDWFLPRYYGREVSGGKIAWVHPSKQVEGRDIGLYTMTWENPRPMLRSEPSDYIVP